MTSAFGMAGPAFDQLGDLRAIAVAPAGSPHAGTLHVVDRSAQSTADRLLRFAPDGTLLGGYDASTRPGAERAVPTTLAVAPDGTLVGVGYGLGSYQVIRIDE